VVGGVVFGLLVGLFFGVVGGVLGGFNFHSTSTQDISSVETVRWSWSQVGHFLSSFVPMFVYLLLAGVVMGLALGLVSWLGGEVVVVEGLGGGPIRRVVVGVAGAVGLALFLMLFLVLLSGPQSGLVFVEIQTRTIPNEGVLRSARNALCIGLVSGLYFGLVFGLIFDRVFAVVSGLEFGLVSALYFGLGVGLRVGGEACLKHLVLRLWLTRNGSTPWNYVCFLDYAADRLLLRKVGGGYAFIHRMLLDYFAARYLEPSRSDARSDKPSSTEAELQQTA
jgi:hypothetical protein